MENIWQNLGTMSKLKVYSALDDKRLVVIFRWNVQSYWTVKWMLNFFPDSYLRNFVSRLSNNHLKSYVILLMAKWELIQLKLCITGWVKCIWKKGENSNTSALKNCVWLFLFYNSTAVLLPVIGMPKWILVWIRVGKHWWKFYNILKEQRECFSYYSRSDLGSATEIVLRTWVTSLLVWLSC